MAKHQFAVTTLMGKRVMQRWSPDLFIDDIQVDKAGSLWGERQILQLGAHLDIYTHYRRGSPRGIWRLGNGLTSTSTNTLRVTSMLAPTMQAARGKLPGSSVSGNFGEVVTILALESRKKQRRALQICHLCPSPGNTTMKCPDLLLESDPLNGDYAIYMQSGSQGGMCIKCGRASRRPVTAPTLPLFMPGECKNTNFIGALRQLATYWQQVKSGSPVFGFGLISTIQYQAPPELKLHLIVPENVARLNTLLAGGAVNNLIQTSFRGILYGF